MASEVSGKSDLFPDNLFDDFEHGQDGEKIKKLTTADDDDHSFELLQLREENSDLRERLRLFQQPSLSENGHSCSPLAQLLIFNNQLASTHIPMIEEFLSQIVAREGREKSQNDNAGNDHEQTGGSKADRMDGLQNGLNLDDGLNVTGNILIYRGFVVDTIGTPSNVNSGQTTGTHQSNVPYYSQDFDTVLPCSKAENSVRLARNRRSCFNCGRTNHALKDCPEPHDQTRIAERRREFQEQAQTPSSVRYHGEENTPNKQHRFDHFRPGHLSDALRTALGLSDSDLPLHIYRMRNLGYPPGYQIAEQLGQQIVPPTLQLYGSEKDSAAEQCKVSHVLYHGFNAPPPPGVYDRHQELGYPPPEYQFPEETKKRKCADATNHPSAKRLRQSDTDMDIDHDLEEGELLESPRNSPCELMNCFQNKASNECDSTNVPTAVHKQEAKEDLQLSAPRKRWSTDFPPDMAPVDQDLKHTWLTLRKIVQKNSKKLRRSL